MNSSSSIFETTGEALARIADIRQSYPNNLMARHFDTAHFASLPSDHQARLLRIFASGIANPDSQMGAYAMRPDDYDLFRPSLEPMIRDYHGIDPATEIRQRHDWGGDGADHDLNAIDPALAGLSIRVRVARNAADFPLPGAMSRADRETFEARMIEAFAALIGDPAYGGQYLSLTPGSPYELTSEEYKVRVAAHQMFKDMSGDPYLDAAGISADWPHGRGMYVSADENFLVWIGEEDHMRVMSMRHGGSLTALFERLRAGLEKIEILGPSFARSPVYGYVTSCPTNLGAGMRASIHLPLPNLTDGGRDLDKAKAVAREHGLSVRGAGGEHTAVGAGGIVDISPSARLMITEAQIRRRLYEGIAALWEAEKKCGT